MNIALPEKVSGIIHTLQAAGFEAYAVGGCIRDSVLGRRPNDWDITTSAHPEQVKALFRRTVDTGLAHGTVTVLLGDGAFEITTYRTDGEYTDSRHPSSVEFVSSLEEDLQRRDFTINAMAYNEERGLVDPFDGFGDLQRCLIRCVGDPFARLSEDALRILRSIRFSAQLSFSIEEKTRDAMRALASSLNKISAERICMELMKLITSPHPEYLRDAYRLGITSVILPELDTAMETTQRSRFHLYTVGEHTIHTMQAIAPDPVLRWTMLLHDLGKPQVKTTDEEEMDHFRGHQEVSAQMAAEILHRLKMDNETIRQVTTLVRYHDWRYPPEDKNIRRALNRLGPELYASLLEVQRADAKGKSSYYQKETLDYIDELERRFRRILKEEQCFSLKDLAVSGKDLIEMGVKSGPRIGALLKEALELILEDPEKNRHEVLLEYINNIIKNGGAV